MSHISDHTENHFLSFKSVKEILINGKKAEILIHGKKKDAIGDFMYCLGLGERRQNSSKPLIFERCLNLNLFSL